MKFGESEHSVSWYGNNIVLLVQRLRLAAPSLWIGTSTTRVFFFVEKLFFFTYSLFFVYDYDYEYDNGDKTTMMIFIFVRRTLAFRPTADSPLKCRVACVDGKMRSVSTFGGRKGGGGGARTSRTPRGGGVRVGGWCYALARPANGQCHLLFESHFSRSTTIYLYIFFFISIIISL